MENQPLAVTYTGNSRPFDPAFDIPGNTGLNDDTLTPQNSDSLVEAWQPAGKATDRPSYIWPDSPSEDVSDNPKAKEPEYRMTEALTPIPGYEDVKLSQSKPLPPPKKPGKGKSQAEKVQNQEVADVDKFVAIEKPEAKEALNKHVTSQCCYGSKPVKEMEIEGILLETALKYTLQSYLETRTIQLKFAPYKGGQVDGSEKKAPELPWEIEVLPDLDFLDHSRTIVIPNTSRVGICHGCNSRGFTKCYRCQGRGMVRCDSCKGTGLKDKNREMPCKSCKATGRKGCLLCKGHACNTCPVCQGFRKLKFFVVLNINFETCREETIVGEVKIPKKLLGNVKGEKLFQDTAPKVKPLTAVQMKDLNHVSSEMLKKHDSNWPKKLIIQQFHEVEAVPIFEITYEWKNKPGKYWVYGHEAQVHSPGYPHNCCCCCRCSIL